MSRSLTLPKEEYREELDKRRPGIIMAKERRDKQKHVHYWSQNDVKFFPKIKLNTRGQLCNLSDEDNNLENIKTTITAKIKAKIRKR